MKTEPNRPWRGLEIKVHPNAAAIYVQYRTGLSCW